MKFTLNALGLTLMHFFEVYYKNMNLSIFSHTSTQNKPALKFTFYTINI